MIVVEIRSRVGETRWHENEKSEVTIGRLPANDLVLAAGIISKRHARLVEREGLLIVVDLKSTNGTYVNGRKITSPLVIKDSDRLYIGDFVLTCELKDGIELELLTCVAQQEEGSRLVYADWLETQGDMVRAEFLRIQDRIWKVGNPDFEVLSERMRELAVNIKAGWRRRVARVLIGNCLELECPRWGALSPTEQPRERYCSSCNKNVYYCGTRDEWTRHAEEGHRVAFACEDLSMLAAPDPTVEGVKVLDLVDVVAIRRRRR
jgi:uncharacterized protein (TIGR02996 family)